MVDDSCTALLLEPLHKFLLFQNSPFQVHPHMHKPQLFLWECRWGMCGEVVNNIR